VSLWRSLTDSRRCRQTVAEYDHYAPAAYLAMHPDAVSGPHLNEALERFEGLFRELNSLL